MIVVSLIDYCVGLVYWLLRLFPFCCVCIACFDFCCLNVDVGGGLVLLLFCLLVSCCTLFVVTLWCMVMLFC